MEVLLQCYFHASHAFENFPCARALGSTRREGGAACSAVNKAWRVDGPVAAPISRDNLMPLTDCLSGALVCYDRGIGRRIRGCTSKTSWQTPALGRRKAAQQKKKKKRQQAGTQQVPAHLFRRGHRPKECTTPLPTLRLSCCGKATLQQLLAF